MRAVRVYLIHPDDVVPPSPELHVKVAMDWLENLQAGIIVDGRRNLSIDKRHHNSESSDAVDRTPSNLKILETLRSPEVQHSIRRHYEDAGLKQLLDAVNRYIRDYGNGEVRPIEPIIFHPSAIQKPKRPASANTAATLLRFPGG